CARKEPAVEISSEMRFCLSASIRALRSASTTAACRMVARNSGKSIQGHLLQLGKRKQERSEGKVPRNPTGRFGIEEPLDQLQQLLGRICLGKLPDPLAVPAEV